MLGINQGSSFKIARKEVETSQRNLSLGLATPLRSMKCRNREKTKESLAGVTDQMRGDGHGWECHSDWALGEGGPVMNDSLRGNWDASPNNRVEGVLLGQISVW